MATTRKSPTLSPTKTVLPLIMAEGRLGLNRIACNRSGAGLGGMTITAAAALVPRPSRASAAGGLVGSAVTLVATTPGGRLAGAAAGAVGSSGVAWSARAVMTVPGRGAAIAAGVGATPVVTSI